MRSLLSPGQELILQDDNSQIGGSIGFYFQTRGEDGKWRNGEKFTAPLLSPKLNGRVLSFETIHDKKHGSPELAPNNRYRVEFIGAKRQSPELLYTAIPGGKKITMSIPVKAEARSAAPDVLWTNGRFGQTSRRDTWWLSPLLVFLGFGAFLVYANWAAFQNAHYTYGPYISPFYSPEIFGDSPHAMFGPKPSWYPGFLPFSPALLILWIPGLFRFTCYYYRGAYYKAFWADPPACSVGEPRKTYLGERRFPLILQNFHRYFLRLSYIVWGFLVYDVWKALWFKDGFGIGVGTIVLAVNVVLLGCYVFGCHAFRHLIGGVFDQVSDHPVRHKLYDCVSCLNGNHKKWAWASLFSVGFADIYVRLCSMGIWSDWRII